MVIDCNCLITDEYSVEDLLGEMKRSGTDKALVSIPSHRNNHEELLGAVKKYSGILYGLYNADPHDARIAEKMEKAFQDGFVGVRLCPLDYGFFLDDLKLLRPILDVCRKCGRPVWIYCTADVCCCPILIKNAATEYPDLCFILGFMGFNYETNGAVTLAREYPNVYLDCSCAMFSNLSNAIMQSEGKKVLYGSSAGYGSFMIIELKKIRHLQLPAEVENRVLYENAARVFGI